MVAASNRKQADRIAICGREALLEFANLARKAPNNRIVLRLASDVQKK